MRNIKRGAYSKMGRGENRERGREGDQEWRRRDGRQEILGEEKKGEV